MCCDYASALRDGSYKVQSSGRARFSLSRTSSPCFSSRPGSWHGVYVSWLSGGLTRHMLRDIADASLVAKFLDNPVPGSFMDSSRTSLPGSCELSKWFPVCVTPSGRDVIGAGVPQTPSISGVPPSLCTVVQPGSGSVGGGLRVFPWLGSPGNRDAPVDGFF